MSFISVFSNFTQEPTSFCSSENCLQAKAPPVDGVESAAYTKTVFASEELLITVIHSFCIAPGSSVWIKIDSVRGLSARG